MELILKQITYLHYSLKEKAQVENLQVVLLFQIYFSLARVYEHKKDYKKALLTLRMMENQFKEHAQYGQVLDKIQKLDKLAWL